MSYLNEIVQESKSFKHTHCFLKVTIQQKKKPNKKYLKKKENKTKIKKGVEKDWFAYFFLDQIIERFRISAASCTRLLSTAAHCREQGQPASGLLTTVLPA